MNKMTVQIVKANTANGHGHIYPLGELQKCSCQNKDRTIPGTLGESDFKVDLQKVSHMVTNLRIEDDWLVGDITILDTPAGNCLKEMVNESICFKPTGYGIVKCGIIEDYTLVSIDAILKVKDEIKNYRRNLD